MSRSPMAVAPILSVAFVGSDDQPLFVQGFAKEDTGRSGIDQQVDELEILLALQCSLDQVGLHLRLAAQAIQRGESRAQEPYLGVLTPVLFNAEEYNIYGYLSATNVKVLAIVKDGLCKQRRDEDALMRSLLRQLHLLQVDAASNPFYAGLNTASFNAKVVRIVDHHAAMMV
eukprot:TRINITY_DN6955_c0_g1_i1.p1 TRINITY_DN6955_c0_g1~~TRINITY_DN6955_c0_g1_i1.p1  ORF type:complete len:172 (+),score=41.94 TRINITY_DN6955_c0_g1_i1:138-653(+)